MQDEFERSAPEYISVGFAAKHCGVSNTTVLRWINNGHLPAFRLPGGHYRIEREDFSQFLISYSMPVRHIRYELGKQYQPVKQRPFSKSISAARLEVPQGVINENIKFKK